MIDAIELEVMWSRLLGVVNEQAAALIRTSFSPVIRDSGDLSAGLFDRRGLMIAQADTGTPGHINSMATGVKHFLREYPPDTLRPGDVLITNDPWFTSGQLHDLTIVTPVFRDGSDGRPCVVGFFGSTCHAVDIGGRTLGAEAREVYEEGLAIPITKLYDRGEPNRELFKLIRANVREPDVVVGDIHAQVASGDVGAARLLEFMDEFGLDDLVPLADEIIGRSEQAMRAAIARLLDGDYRNEMWTDGYDEPVKIALRVRVRGDRVEADFTGSSPQSPYGINVVLNYTHAYVTYAFKCLISPEVPNNDGSFRPVSIVAPEGCVLNARRPAAVAARHVLGHFIPATIFGALQGMLPAMSEGAGNIWAVQTNGTGLAGRPYASIFFTAGGTGARSNSDGIHSAAFPSGISGVPAEVIEATSPLVVHRRELRIDSGGPGKWRGGLGHEMVIGTRSRDPYTVSVLFDRSRYPARGYAGGGEGARGEVIHGDGRPSASKAKVTLRPDETFTIRLPGGGGYGAPVERDPELVARDVRFGFVSLEKARDVYRVALRADGSVDEAETRRLRY